MENFYGKNEVFCGFLVTKNNRYNKNYLLFIGFPMGSELDGLFRSAEERIL
jgi:hypothetical protein